MARQVSRRARRRAPRAPVSRSCENHDLFLQRDSKAFIDAALCLVKQRLRLVKARAARVDEEIRMLLAEADIAKAHALEPDRFDEPAREVALWILERAPEARAFGLFAPQFRELAKQRMAESAPRVEKRGIDCLADVARAVAEPKRARVHEIMLCRGDSRENIADFIARNRAVCREAHARIHLDKPANAARQMREKLEPPQIIALGMRIERIAAKRRANAQEPVWQHRECRELIAQNGKILRCGRDEEVVAMP